MKILPRITIHLVISFLFASLNVAAQAELKPAPAISKTNTAIYNFDVNVFDTDLSSFYSVSEEMRDDFYKMITDSINAINGIKIKHKSFLAGKIKYDHYGYPASKGKKAAESNKADNYISIGVMVGSTGMRKPPNESNPDDCVLKLQVEVKLSVTVFDKAGEIVFDETCKAKSPEKIEFHYAKVYLGKIEGKKMMSSDPKLIYELTKVALDEMTHQKLPK